MKIVKYYFDNLNNSENLEKTINICYEEKYKLSDIAKIIMQTDDNNKIQILNNNLEKNYSGDYTKLQKLNLSLFGLKESLKRFETNYVKMKDEIINTIVSEPVKENNTLPTPSAIAYGVQSLFASLTTGAYGFGSLQTCNHKFVFVLFFI